VESPIRDMLKRTELEKTAKILGGLLIWRSSPRGDAARAGVRQGDILLAVNGVPTPDVMSFMYARRLRQDRVTLDLFRFGERLRIEVELSLPQDESATARSSSQASSAGSVAARRRKRSASAASN